MKFRVLLLLCAACIVLSACSGTKTVARWRDDVYKERPAKLFVVCWLEEPGPRRLVEESIVRQSKKRGADAVAASSLSQGDARPAREALLAKAREAGADAILVLRFLRKEAGDRNSPFGRSGEPLGFNADWDRLAGMSSDMAVHDVSYDYDVITLESVLYRTGSGEPIWSAMSQTTFRGPAIRQIDRFTSAVMKELVEAKLVP